MTNLQNELLALPYQSLCNESVARRYIERAQEGDITRDENPITHVCGYFLPFNPVTGQVFFAHHKKAGLWIAPGGHIDVGESIKESVAREVGEEIGVRMDATQVPDPFLVTITEIDNPPRACRRHFDIWHLLEMDGSDFQVDPREFHEVRWLTLDEARELVTDPSNREALDWVEGNLKASK